MTYGPSFTYMYLCISMCICLSIYGSVFLHLSAKSQKDWRRETVICWPEPKCDFENTEAGGKGRYLSALSSPTQAPPHPPCGPVPRSLGPLRPSSASPLPFPRWKTGPRMFCASCPPVGAPLHTCPPARGLDIKDSSVETPGEQLAPSKGAARRRVQTARVHTKGQAGLS